MSEPLNLYQRLQKIAMEVGAVELTGTNRFGKKALSIGDVENEIRGAMAGHGVISRWSILEARPLVEGKMAEWIVTCQVVLTNADRAEDCCIDQMMDTGSSVTAASSFCAKNYYRKLFHLAEDESDGKPQPVTQNGTTQRAAPPRNVDRQTGEVVEARPSAAGRYTAIEQASDGWRASTLAALQAFEAQAAGNKRGVAAYIQGPLKRRDAPELDRLTDDELLALRNKFVPADGPVVSVTAPAEAAPASNTPDDDIITTI